LLDSATKKRIDDVRDILVGKVPVPSSQVEQITIALIYKFMYDMDNESISLGGNPKFFTGDYAQYAWDKLLDQRLSGKERVRLYQDALANIPSNPQLPTLFRDIFKNAFLPYQEPETLKLFLKHIDEFTYDHSEKLGDAFEYLLAVLGSQGDAGQFRTPRHIIDFMVELIDPQKDDSILDPACGTAGFLISAYKHIIKTNSSNYDKDKDPQSFTLHHATINEHDVQEKKYNGDLLTPDQRALLHKNIRGYDISFEMVRLSLVNMYLHGFNTPQIYEYDTLTSTDRWNEYASVILANPPFMSPRGGISPHQKFSIQSKRSEVLFVDYMLEHLTNNGRAGIIVPEGIIFKRDKAYKELRKLMVEENYLVGVISLPAGVFKPYSGVKTSILWIDKQLARKTDKIIFLKINNDGFDLGDQRRPIEANDLPAAFDNAVTYKNAVLSGAEYQVPEQDVILVEKKKLAEGGEYNLSGERYRKCEVASSSFVMVCLQEVAEVNPSFKRLGHCADSDLVPFLPMSDLDIDAYMFTPKQERKLSEVKKGYTYFENLDILLAKITPSFENGKIGIVSNMSKGFGFGSTEYHVIRCGESVLPQYIYHLLNTDEFRMKAKTQMTGSAGQQRVPEETIKEYHIPVPPLSIQEEIVAELGSYQKIIDGAKQVIDNWKPHIDIDPDWNMVKLKELCTFEYGKGLPEKNRITGPFPVLGSNGIVGYHNSSFVQGPAIVVGRKGSAGEVVWEDRNCWPIDTTFYVKHDESKVDYRYLYYVLKMVKLQNLRGGTGSPGLNRNDAYEVKIPLPSLSTQKDITQRIGKEEAIVNATRELVSIHIERISNEIESFWIQ